MSLTLPHLSYSCISTFADCPRSFWSKYVLEEKSPPGEAAQFGTTFDQMIAVKAGLKNLCEVKDPNMDGMAEAITIYTNTRGVPELLNEAVDSQHKITLTPEQWEAYADIHGAGGAGTLPADFIGYVDLMGEDDIKARKWVLDAKTSTRKGFQTKWALQTTLYCLAVGAQTAHVHLLTRTKVPAVYKYSWKINSGMIAWSMNVIGWYTRQLKWALANCKSADDLPANPDYYCSWCPMNMQCPGVAVSLIKEEM